MRVRVKERGRPSGAGTACFERLSGRQRALEQLRNMRVKIQELEAAYNELNEAIASQLVEVRGVVKE